MSRRKLQKSQWPPVVALLLAGAFVVTAHSPETQPARFSIFHHPSLPETKLALLTHRPGPIEKFERHYGMPDGSLPAPLQMLARAKYRADEAVFTVHTIANHLEDLVEIRYSRGKIGRASVARLEAPPAMPRTMVTLEDARLKFDLDLAGGKPYVGVRLVLPFGN